MGLELADLFREYGADYRKKYADKLLPSHRQAMRAIEHCRTERLGGQVYGCPTCQEFQYSYHSCRNRHCPKCQHEQTQNWLRVQQGLLLNAPYFFLTFTLPAELRSLVRAHQKALYSLLFQSSAEVTQKLARDPRYIGGQIGLVGVLHTWTRNLIFHPHVHYLAPAGGLHADGKTWLPARQRFFLPVRALSKLFRAAFKRGLQKLKLFDNVPSNVWTQDWVVHCKPVGDGQAALKYLAPYIHRVAISNRRLLAFNNGGSMESSQVTFQYRASDTGQLKRCTLSVEQFFQRFLQHVLPHAFVKVRYFGFFGASVRRKLAALQIRLGSQVHDSAEHQAVSSPSAPETPSKILCPTCGQAMTFQRNLSPLQCRSP
ncbi:MAG: IS91 family transposase [Anaerolineales bacterium]|nr:MAG: IS91 family transposase [Anaerolineales bacterium]WKZ34727.1 MAG: IS91 family transposase [Anaerolineales bacterium]